MVPLNNLTRESRLNFHVHYFSLKKESYFRVLFFLFYFHFKNKQK